MRTSSAITEPSRNAPPIVFQFSLAVKAFLSAGGLGDRLGTAQVSALLKRALLATDSPHGKLRLGVPQHALRFYFPKSVA